MTTFNPFAMTNVQDSFSVQSNGFWQGDLQADPAGRFQLAAGVIKSTETLPMWGGIAIFEDTPPATPANGYAGSIIGRFTSDMVVSGKKIAGFTVFNGTYSLPTTPQSPVPLGSAGNSFNFVRVGTNNRIVVKCSSGVVALAGSQNPQSFSWDADNQQLIPVSLSPDAISLTATLIQVDTNGATVVYDDVTGFATWNTASNVAVIQI